jgi:hypothetical protein
LRKRIIARQLSERKRKNYKIYHDSGIDAVVQALSGQSQKAKRPHSNAANGLTRIEAMF